MTAALIFFAKWFAAGLLCAPVAIAFLTAGARADDLSARNNAAGEKGEGEKIAGHLVQRNKSNGGI